MKKGRLLLLSIVLIMNQSLSAGVVIPHVKITPAELESYLISHPAEKSFSQWYLSVPTTRFSKWLSIVNRFRELEPNEPDRAYLELQKITDWLYTHDWLKEERKVITWALFKLALNEKSELKQSDWLTQAHQFSQEWDPEDYKDIRLTPELKRKWLTTKSQRPQFQWYPQESYLRFQYLILNGKKQKLNPHKAISLPMSMARLVFISDHFEPYLYVGDTYNLPKQAPLKPWVNPTDCKSQISLHQSLHKAIHQALRSLHSQSQPPYCPLRSFMYLNIKIAKLESSLLPLLKKATSLLFVNYFLLQYLQKPRWLLRPHSRCLPLQKVTAHFLEVNGFGSEFWP